MEGILATIKEQSDWEDYCCDYEESVPLSDSLNACMRRLKYIHQEELFTQSKRFFCALNVYSNQGMYCLYHDEISIRDDLKEKVGYDEEKVNAFFTELNNYKIEDGTRLLPEYVQYLIALGNRSYETESSSDIYELFTKWTYEGSFTAEKGCFNVPATDKIKVNMEARMQIFNFAYLHPSRLSEERFQEFTAKLGEVIPNFECYVKDPKLLSTRLNPNGDVYYLTVQDPEYTVVICYRLEGDIVKILTGFKVAKELNLKIE